MKTKKTLSTLSKSFLVASLLIGAACNQSDGATPQNPRYGLVGLFQGENSAYDAAQCGQTGEILGSISYSPGVVGEAFSFNGSANLRCPINVSCPAGAGPGLTIALWIKPNDVTSYQTLVTWSGGTSGFWISGYFPMAGCLTALGNGYLYSSGAVLSPNQWQHVAMTYDYATGRERIFHNGVKVYEAIGGMFEPGMPSGDLLIGGDFPYYTGGMDEVAIYNRALDEEEIAYSAGIMTYTPVPGRGAPAGLVGWWPGQYFPNDLTQYKQNAVEIGNVGYADAQIGHGFLFDGNSYLNTWLPDMTGEAGFTIEFWVKSSTVGPMITWGYGINAVEFGLYHDYPCVDPGAVGVFPEAILRTSQGTYGTCNSTAYIYPYTESEWRHMALTYDKASKLAKMYMNGGLISTVSVADGDVLLPDSYFTVAHDYQTGASFQGMMDEISLYNRALSANEIAEIASTPVEGKVLPVLPGCWNPAVTSHQILAWYKGEGNGLDATGGHNSIDMSYIHSGYGEVGRGFVFPPGAYTAVWDSNIPFGGPGYATSIELWIKPASVSQDQNILGWLMEEGGWGTHLGITASGTLYATIGSGNPPMLESGQVCIANEWQHIALVCDHYFGYATLYHNGINVASQYVGSFLETSDMLSFGPFEGSMDEITFIGSYLGGLSQSDVQAIYQAGPSGKLYDPSCFEQ